MIESTLRLIKEQIGLDLQLDDCFDGVRSCNGNLYFNVKIDKVVSESIDATKLYNFSDKYNLIKIEPNGYKRIAIYPLNK